MYNFQILDANNTAITAGELDRQAAAFWGVEVGANHFTAPYKKDDADAMVQSWHDAICVYIAMAKSNNWDDVIAKYLEKRTVSAHTKYYTDLMNHWKSLGYTPVSELENW